MTKEEFIGKLQMCYFGDRNAFDEIVGEYDRLNNIDSIMYNVLNEFINENDELKKIQCTFLGTGCKKQLEDMKQEIDKLNNIINELEKWLKEDLKNNYRDAGYRHNFIIEILNKLKELKDSD